MKKKDKTGGLATSLFKALDLLGLVASKKEGRQVSEMVAQMDLPRSSVIRMLDSLQHYGLITRDEHKRYRVTNKFLDWKTESPDERMILKYKPLMEHLVEEVNEMVVLGRLQGRKIKHLHVIEPNRRVRVISPMGRRFEIHKLAMGKLVLGQRPDLIPNGIDEPHIEEIEQAKLDGFAWNRSDAESDIVGWSTWLGKPSGMTPLIAITWPTYRFADEQLERAKEILKEEGLA